MASPATAVFCIGMAGSGKTTFMQRINAYLHEKKMPPYVMNLDPAVRNVPFESNIDIRDSINYKEVMAQYNLGPNGGILTSLNLFTTKVDQIVSLLEKRCMGETNEDSKVSDNSPPQHIIIDTPGQIEVFVWSASGQILTSALASSFPTVVAYIIDTPRTASTSTFMSNMLYACSLLYKYKLPMILVFNKTDVQSADFAQEWMTDFEAFQAGLKKEEETGRFGGVEGVGGPAVGGSGYMSSFINSMSLVLEEFYRHLSIVQVSAVTGAGIDDFFAAVEQKKQEFNTEYKPELERRQKEQQEQRSEQQEKRSTRRQQDLGRFIKDLSLKESDGQRDTQAHNAEPETISDLEDQDESDSVDSPSEGSAGGDGFEEGLADRYRRALQEGEMPSGEDFSFARYIANTQRH